MFYYRSTLVRSSFKSLVANKVVARRLWHLYFKEFFVLAFDFKVLGCFFVTTARIVFRIANQCTSILSPRLKHLLFSCARGFDTLDFCFTVVLPFKSTPTIYFLCCRQLLYFLHYRVHQKKFAVGKGLLMQKAFNACKKIL